MSGSGRRSNKRSTKKEEVGPLHGLPIAFKDLSARCRLPFHARFHDYRDANAACQDSVLVERLRKAGAIPIGKTNTPEFGMGSHTYNKVYGTTVNPFDYTKSAGGSTAAVQVPPLRAECFLSPMAVTMPDR